jgi:hypothetical protein
VRCVLAQHFTIKKALSWKSAIEERPPYQRESAVWSLDKQQLFIDSILNGYDVPKIYLHDLRGEHPTKVYSIVDGKQRLTTLWAFLTDGFPLAADFKIEPRNIPPDLPDGALAPSGGLRFSQFHPAWRELFEQTFLSVVLIRFATEEDIEELFSRLNNGEPLNAAEKRNAMGGDLVRLIRTVAARPFFRERVAFGNGRHQHNDLAARLLAIALAERSGASAMPDLRSHALDALVRAHRHLPDEDREAMETRVVGRLELLERLTEDRDSRLSTPAQALLVYLLAADVEDAGTATQREFMDFLAWFGNARTEALDRPEGDRDPELVEFSELNQHGATEGRNIDRRLAIVRRQREQWSSAPATAATQPGG